MKPIKWKVCGMREPENINQVSALVPDYMGFIFYPESPRWVGSDFDVPESLPAETKRVGVFVHATTSEVLHQVGLHQLDYVQLHGDEPVSFCEKISQKGVKVIKVFRVDDSFDFTETILFEKVASYFLFDTRGKQFGGNAHSFDWEMLHNYNQQVPFFLSGGITPQNVTRISKMKDLNLHAIDINSGAEDKPGKKNVNLLKKIIDQL